MSTPSDLPWVCLRTLPHAEERRPSAGRERARRIRVFRVVRRRKPEYPAHHGKLTGIPYRTIQYYARTRHWRGTPSGADDARSGARRPDGAEPDADATAPSGGRSSGTSSRGKAPLRTREGTLVTDQDGTPSWTTPRDRGTGRTRPSSIWSTAWPASCRRRCRAATPAGAADRSRACQRSSASGGRDHRRRGA